MEFREGFAAPTSYQQRGPPLRHTRHPFAPVTEFQEQPMLWMDSAMNMPLWSSTGETTTLDTQSRATRSLAYNNTPFGTFPPQHTPVFDDSRYPTSEDYWENPIYGAMASSRQGILSFSPPRQTFQPPELPHYMAPFNDVQLGPSSTGLPSMLPPMNTWPQHSEPLYNNSGSAPTSTPMEAIRGFGFSSRPKPSHSSLARRRPGQRPAPPAGGHQTTQNIPGTTSSSEAQLSQLQGSHVDTPTAGAHSIAFSSPAHDTTTGTRGRRNLKPTPKSVEPEEHISGQCSVSAGSTNSESPQATPGEWATMSSVLEGSSEDFDVDCELEGSVSTETPSLTSSPSLSSQESVEDLAADPPRDSSMDVDPDYQPAVALEKSATAPIVASAQAFHSVCISSPQPTRRHRMTQNMSATKVLGERDAKSDSSNMPQSAPATHLISDAKTSGFLPNEHRATDPAPSPAGERPTWTAGSPWPKEPSVWISASPSGMLLSRPSSIPLQQLGNLDGSLERIFSPLNANRDSGLVAASPATIAAFLRHSNYSYHHEDSVDLFNVVYNVDTMQDELLIMDEDLNVVLRDVHFDSSEAAFVPSPRTSTMTEQSPVALSAEEHTTRDSTSVSLPTLDPSSASRILHTKPSKSSHQTQSKSSRKENGSSKPKIKQSMAKTSGTSSTSSTTRSPASSSHSTLPSSSASKSSSSATYHTRSAVSTVRTTTSNPSPSKTRADPLPTHKRPNKSNVSSSSAGKLLKDDPSEIGSKHSVSRPHPPTPLSPAKTTAKIAHKCPSPPSKTGYHASVKGSGHTQKVLPKPVRYSSAIATKFITSPSKSSATASSVSSSSQPKTTMYMQNPQAFVPSASHPYETSSQGPQQPMQASPFGRTSGLMSPNKTLEEKSRELAQRLSTSVSNHTVPMSSPTISMRPQAWSDPSWESSMSESRTQTPSISDSEISPPSSPYAPQHLAHPSKFTHQATSSQMKYQNRQDAKRKARRETEMKEQQDRLRDNAQSRESITLRSTTANTQFSFATHLKASGKTTPRQGKAPSSTAPAKNASRPTSSTTNSGRHKNVFQATQTMVTKIQVPKWFKKQQSLHGNESEVLSKNSSNSSAARKAVRFVVKTSADYAPKKAQESEELAKSLIDISIQLDEPPPAETYEKQEKRLTELVSQALTTIQEDTPQIHDLLPAPSPRSPEHPPTPELTGLDAVVTLKRHRLDKAGVLKSSLRTGTGSFVVLELYGTLEALSPLSRLPLYFHHGKAPNLLPGPYRTAVEGDKSPSDAQKLMLLVSLETPEGSPDLSLFVSQCGPPTLVKCPNGHAHSNSHKNRVPPTAPAPGLNSFETTHEACLTITARVISPNSTVANFGGRKNDLTLHVTCSLFDTTGGVASISAASASRLPTVSHPAPSSSSSATMSTSSPVEALRSRAEGQVTGTGSLPHRSFKVLSCVSQFTKFNLHTQKGSHPSRPRFPQATTSSTTTTNQNVTTKSRASSTAHSSSTASTSSSSSSSKRPIPRTSSSSSTVELKLKIPLRTLQATASSPAIVTTRDLSMQSSEALSLLPPTNTTRGSPRQAPSASTPKFEPQTPTLSAMLLSLPHSASPPITDAPLKKVYRGAESQEHLHAWSPSHSRAVSLDCPGSSTAKKTVKSSANHRVHHIASLNASELDAALPQFGNRAMQDS